MNWVSEGKAVDQILGTFQKLVFLLEGPEIKWAYVARGFFFWCWDQLTPLPGVH